MSLLRAAAVLVFAIAAAGCATPKAVQCPTLSPAAIEIASESEKLGSWDKTGELKTDVRYEFSRALIRDARFVCSYRVEVAGKQLPDAIQFEFDGTACASRAGFNAEGVCDAPNLALCKATCRY